MRRQFINEIGAAISTFGKTLSIFYSADRAPGHDFQLYYATNQSKLKVKITRSKGAITRVKLATMLHPGGTVSHPHHREAQIKITLSFQNLEAALPLGMVQAADPVAREVLLSRNWRH